MATSKKTIPSVKTVVVKKTPVAKKTAPAKPLNNFVHGYMSGRAGRQDAVLRVSFGTAIPPSTFAGQKLVGPVLVKGDTENYNVYTVAVTNIDGQLTQDRVKILKFFMGLAQYYSLTLDKASFVQAYWPKK